MSATLIIDDDKLVCHAITDVAKTMGHDVVYALTLGDGLRQARSKEFDVVFLDVRLPDGNGLEVLPRICETLASPEVIIITGEGEPDGAELAIRSGAWDYIEKPLSMEKIKLPLVRALQYREEKKAKKRSAALKRDSIIGGSWQIKQCLDLLAQAANSEANVLITGETGTGKELFAEAVHENSVRGDKNFVVVDCAALPETLVESTLFGHKKGAFTGADKNQEGLVRQTDGGTLFLDEVGELPLSVQKKFLRVLDNQRFRPVGGGEELKSDFRLVSATNRDLDEMVKAGKYRKDLLFRLRSTVINLPPLRKRGKDIKDIACHYVNEFCDRLDTGTKGFSPEFIEMLASYSWPGNVRELIHAMENALSNARNGSTLFSKHLPDQIRIELARGSVNGSSNHASETKVILPEHTHDLQTVLKATERQYLENLIFSTKGNMQEACRISGLSRSVFYDRLKKYDVRRPS